MEKLLSMWIEDQNQRNRAHQRGSHPEKARSLLQDLKWEQGD